MLRINERVAGRERVVLDLEGSIVDAWVAVLEEECARLAGNGRAVLLDLANVIYLDAVGAALVARLERQGVRLVRCPGVIREILEEQ